MVAAEIKRGEGLGEMVVEGFEGGWAGVVEVGEGLGAGHILGLF
jgi:hypothetical protein